MSLTAAGLGGNRLGAVVFGLAACSLLGHGTMRAATAYKVDHARSYLLVIVGKSGAFSFAGHEHAALATEWSFESSIDASNLKDSAVTITIPVSSLIVDTAESRRLAGLGSGPSPGDVRKVQDTMLGPEVLDARNHPTIVFTSSSVAAGASELRLTGQFRMHGQAREITTPVRYTRSPDGGFLFSGEFQVRQTDFGIKPVSVGMGTVNVKNEVRIRFAVSVLPAP
jgi:polyisoprenoid-binding protein YceI